MKMVKGKGKKKVAPRKPKTTAQSKSTDLVKVNERNIQEWQERHNSPRMPVVPEMSEAQIIKAFDILGITAKLKTDHQKQLFVAVAKEWKLNPLKRQIHAVAMGGDDDEGNSGTLVPVVGYEVYIERAEATGRLEYWHPTEEGEIKLGDDWRKSDFAVTVTIKRRDQPKEFNWKVRFVEAVAIKKSTQKPNAMWAKRPHFMTTKAAIGQAFRLCFREVLLGMPYVDAEIAYQQSIEEEREVKTDIPAPQAVAGVEVQENGKISREEGNALKVDVNAIAEKARELNAARSEVQTIFSRMAKKITTADNTEIMLYTVEELETMKQQAKAATSDIEKLHSYALDWTADYTSRLADKGFGG
jgi:phage recombination protein Bet